MSQKIKISVSTETIPIIVKKEGGKRKPLMVRHNCSPKQIQLNKIKHHMSRSVFTRFWSV